MGITIDAGNGDIYELEHAVFDVNGTLTQDGQLVPGVIERMHSLRRIVKVHLLTADTYRTQQSVINPMLAVDIEPTITWKILDQKDGPEDQQKRQYVLDLGKDTVAAIGNGINDRLMLAEARLGIVVLGPEGTAVEALRAAKIAARDPITALDLLLHPMRLRASLRT
jgi:soluble P-type ATPase